MAKAKGKTPDDSHEPDVGAEREADRSWDRARERGQEEDRDAAETARREERRPGEGEGDGNRGLGDVARRIMRAGAGAFLDRAVVPELPKEVAMYLLRVGEDVRDDILRIFGRELRRVLETMNLGEELQKILTSTSFEIKTEIRFIPNDQSVLKNLRNTSIRMKRVDKDGKVTEEVLQEPSDDDPKEET